MGASLAALLCGLGCLAAPEALLGPTDPPSEEVTERPGTDLAVSVREVMLLNAESAFALPGDGLIVSSTTGAFYLAGPAAQVVELGSIPGVLRSVVSVRGNQHLIAGAGGLFVLDGGALSRSPLEAALDGDPALEILLTPGPDRQLDVWIAGEAHLWLWRAGSAFRVDTAGLPTARARLAFGAPADGKPALWVAAEGALYALVTDGQDLTVHPDVDPSIDPAAPSTERAAGLAVDGEGTLWLAAGGALYSRGYDGTWHPHPVVRDVAAIAGRASALDLWIQAAGEIWHHERGTFRQVADAPKGQLFGVASSGYALLGTAGQVVRLEAGRVVDLDGVADGDLVSAPTTVLLRAEAPSAIDDVTAAVDGVPIQVEQFPWRVALDPRTLGDGFHSLTVHVTYADGGPDGNGRVGFYVGASSIPRWAGDISVLSAERCDECHGERGNAHRMDTKDLWIEDIDRIGDAIREARMPLPPKPPLQPSKIDRIAAWRAAGFP